MKRQLREAFLAWTEREDALQSEGQRQPSRLFGAVSWPLSGVWRMLHGIRSLTAQAPAGPVGGTTLAVIASPLVGGVGKTPLVAHLTSIARSRGLRVIVVVRGYGRLAGTRYIVRASADGRNIDFAGDEAVVLAEQADVPVYVAHDPDAAIRHAAKSESPNLILLDDGVRRRWTGERRVVMFTDRDLARPVRYLPYGRWRVPPQHVLPAAGVAIMHDRDGADCEKMRDQHRRRLQSWGFDVPVGWYRTRLLEWARLNDDGSLSKADSPASPPLVFCGIGQPARFARQLRSSGVEPRLVRWFGDHHPYTQRDIEGLVASARAVGASWLLTTHKDAVKIHAEWLDGFPLCVARISLELADGTDMLSVILEPPA